PVRRGPRWPALAGRSLPSASGDQLLAAVDVVRPAGERGVGHQVHGELGDVVRADYPPDGQRGAELLAARLQVVTEQRGRQRGGGEPGGDEVDPDRAA